jgi:hypothetical protein
VTLVAVPLAERTLSPGRDALAAGAGVIHLPMQKREKMRSSKSSV